MNLISRKKGFTLIEILTVMAIIAILAGILVPSMNMVRNTAKKVKQRTQFITIDQALMAFKNDMGYYPNSNWDIANNSDYCGPQKLAEALVGWDLMGFHPDSAWRADGQDSSASFMIYDATLQDNLRERTGPYLKSETANAYKLKNLFNNLGPMLATAGETYVLCDTYGVRKFTYTTPADEILSYKAGTPILYFKANSNSKTMIGQEDMRIYNFWDNMALVDLKSLTSGGSAGKPHKLVGEGVGDPDLNLIEFYEYINDPKVELATETAGPGTGVKWPYNPDTYILISAGPDGLYGTDDDITNF